MNFLKKSFKLGSITLPSNILYAPLAGCSDFPFRQMSAKYQPGIMFCEMVKMEALIRREPNTLRMLEFSKEMRPIGGQICGSNPAIAGEAARIIEDLGFDTVDLNCGCPVDKVTKDGSGSAMLKNPERIGEVISNMVAAVKIPVTVKVRAGWDEKSINSALVTAIAEQAGAKAICIHGRTREQAYRGPANWEWVRQAKAAAKDILVIGNGDIYDGESAKKIFEATGCDAVLVARGTMGNPWVAEDIRNYLEGLTPILRPVAQVREHLYEHFERVCEHHGERKAILEMRRVGCWYIAKSHGSRSFRGLISKATGINEIRELILNHPIDDPSAYHG